ncbi:MAG: monovalent cation/H+ antiporter complex subunit F [Bacteroidota bacterium]|nr:monovalent cation/H+ antiporter complex subunit F [Bacteroidota bacterium]
MVNIILTAALILILTSLLISLIRFIKGPSAVDRVIAFDVMTITSIAHIALIAHFSNRIIYLDVAIVYGLLSFLGVLIVARYIEKGL